LRAWLYALPRYIVAVCDNDSAGQKLGKLGQTSITVEGEKDLGDLTVDETRKLIQKYLPKLFQKTVDK
jgi:hypothetical protein